MKDKEQMEFNFQEIEKELNAKPHPSPEKITSTIQKIKTNKEDCS